MNNRWKRFVYPLLGIIMSAALTVAVAELFLRVFYPQSHYAIENAPWGFRHIPNASIRYYGERGERGRPRGLVPIRYNAHGLRDYDYRYAKPDGTFRILVLGDSWAEDMGSFLENLHAKRLEKKLNARDASHTYEVINAGHYAYDNAQELMYYLFEGRLYNPDVVILMYAGDTAKPKHATMKDGRLQLHVQQFSPAQTVRRKIISFLRQHSELGTLILDRVFTFQRLDDLLIKLKLKEPQVYASFPKDHPMVSGLENKEMAAKVVYQDEPDGFKEVDKEIFLALKHKVEENGGELIFLSVNEISSQAQKDFLADNGFHVLEVDIDFKEMGEERQRDIANGTYNKRVDSHRFGYKRNEVAANQMLDYLLASGLIPSAGEDRHL